MKRVAVILGLLLVQNAFAGRGAVQPRQLDRVREKKVEDQIQQLSDKDKEAISHSVEESDVKNDDDQDSGEKE